MATDSSELLGKALGTCTLKRLIGRGGMGAVYLAQQSRPRRTVAVKVVLPGIVFEQKHRVEFLARFRREADAIAALDHINIMPVYEYGEQGDTAYLVMPYVTGGTLRDVLEKRGTLSPEEVVPIIEQTSAALDSAHAQSIVHRDLKPGNILFHADGRVLLADFGLAKVLKDVTESEGNGHLTSIGTIIGTPEYLSPEQGTGDPIDYHTDIYSLGVMLYQMLAGRVPFSGTSPVAVAIKHALEEPPPPSRFNPSIHPNVEAVIMKAIAKKPAQRYHSAGAFAQALRQAVTETSQSPMEALQNTAAKPSSQRDSTEPPLLISTTNEPEKYTNEDEMPTQASYKTSEANEQAAALSTMLMKDGAHSKETEEPAHLSVKQQEHIQALQTSEPDFSAYTDATVADAPTPAKLLKAQQGEHSTKQPEYIHKEPPVQQQSQQAQIAQFTQAPPVRSRGGRRPIWMIIGGIALVLVILGGGMAAYIQGQSANSNHSGQATIAKATQKAINDLATKTSIPPVQPTAGADTPLPGPYPGVAGVGSKIYGTARPGKDCDTQHAQWENLGSAHLACGNDALELTNTGSNGDQLAGTYLSALPGNQSMPNKYVVQTQATLKPNSHGAFGIVFYNQPGTRYAFIIDPVAKVWAANYYDNNKINNLTEISLQAKIEGTITIDVVASGDTFNLYINGIKESQRANSDFGNTSGNFGLVVAPGADVTFKNTVLYTYNGY